MSEDISAMRGQGQSISSLISDLRAVDGVVGGDVEVVQVCGNLKSLGNIAVVLVLGAGDGIGLSDALGLYEGLVSPYTGVQISGLLLQIIHGHIEELQGSTASQEHDLVGFRDVQEFLPQGAAFIHNGVPLLGAVGNGEDGNTGAAEILQGGDGVVNGYLRQKAGAGVKDVNFFRHGL